MKADLNCWKFNIAFFPDWQQFNFHFRRNTVMRQKCYLVLATDWCVLSRISYDYLTLVAMWDRFFRQQAYIGITWSCMHWYVRKKYPSLAITDCHHSASLVMPISDPRDGIFYPTLTLMMNSYNLLHQTKAQTFYTDTGELLMAKQYNLGKFGRWTARI